MQRKTVFFLLSLMFGFSFLISTSGYTESISGPITEESIIYPENTVILASEMDVRFSRDFSSLLKHLSLDWVVQDSLRVPDVLHSKNIILVGHPDDGVVGEIMKEILTEEEIKSTQNAQDQYLLFEEQSPWNVARKLFICSGADFLLRRNATEALVRQLIDGAPQASDWIRSAYDFEERDGFRDEISQFQYQWEDTELPLEDLMIDVNSKSPWRITSQQAVEDVERLFYLLSHGYSGYAFFNQKGEFEQARTKIVQELSSKTFWTGNGLSNLIYDNLSFIIDCHLSIGDHKFARHQDFWYDTLFELTPSSNGFQFTDRKINYTVVSINDSSPTNFLFPSLNQEGEPIYRVGLLSKEKPEAVTLVGQSDEGEREFDVKLQRSDFSYYADDIVREDLIGGIPVIRVRGFGDADPDELEMFVDTARVHRGDPIVIVDIRGNGGGNERWPISWIQGLTGRRANAVFTTSELESKTSMAGRANAFIYWDASVSDPSLFSSQAKLFTQKAERFEVGQRLPGWTAPEIPSMPLISNDTKVIVITNNLIASAGEGFVMRISQVENVLVVGENTKGCLTFGNISLHQLPHSKLMIWIPINFCIFQDQEFREEVGLFPDLWVPAEDAVNFTVAAIRRGTIATNQLLPEEILVQEFKPESYWRRIINMPTKSWLVLGGLTLLGSIWAHALRKKTPILLVIGGGWIVFGLYWISRRSEKFVGCGFIIVGLIWLVWGAINLRKAQLVPNNISENLME
jgi:hypothetical protein